MAAEQLPEQAYGSNIRSAINSHAVELDGLTSGLWQTDLSVSTLSNELEVVSDQVDELSAIVQQKQPLGVRFLDQFNRSELGTNYTKVGTLVSWVPDGTKLVVSGLTGTTSESDYILYNQYKTNLEEFTIKAQVKMTSAPVATSYGIGFRLQGGSAGVNNKNYWFRFDATTTNNSGTIYVAPGNIAGTEQSTGRIAFAQNDVFDFKLVVVRNIFVASVTNQRTKQTVIHRFIYPLIQPNSYQPMPLNFNCGFISLGGTFEVDDFTLVADQVVNPDFLFIGDSLTAGYFGGSTDDRFANVVGSMDRSKISSVYAKPGLISADLLNNVDEIVAINPKTAFIMLGYNDVAQSIANSTTINNLTTIKNALEAIGTEVIFISIPTASVLNALIVSSFPSNRHVDAFNSVRSLTNVNQYNPLFVVADGIHMNRQGNEMYARVIYSLCRDLFTVAIPSQVNDGSYGNMGNTFNAPPFFGTRDRNAVKFISNNLPSALMGINGSWKFSNDHSEPVSTAFLEISSTTKGFLLPRMTTAQRDAIVTPAEGLMIYNLTTHLVNYHNGTQWRQITDSQA